MAWGAMEVCVPQHGHRCSWGATASVDNAPLRVMKEELEAVQTQPCSSHSSKSLHIKILFNFGLFFFSN